MKYVEGGTGDDGQVEPDGPVIDIVIVEPCPVLDRSVAPEPVDLSPSSQADGDPVTVLVAFKFLAELGDEVRSLRARAH
jgi:hypothetical protein